jgi:mRNA-degrading endonuclease YafQ of YafQ-DinJ toxin-antitoxin module
MERKAKKIEYSKKFLRSLRKLTEKTIDQAEEKEKIFKDDLFHPILKTHKLSGKDKECWAFWINYSHRIKFTFSDDGYVLFLDIGTHDIYE